MYVLASLFELECIQQKKNYAHVQLIPNKSSTSVDLPVRIEIGSKEGIKLQAGIKLDLLIHNLHTVNMNY